eukprot:1923947-Prorocentrum_lima.AAC.1
MSEDRLAVRAVAMVEDLFLRNLTAVADFSKEGDNPQRDLLLELLSSLNSAVGKHDMNSLNALLPDISTVNTL